jgi:hypothetical protein
MTGIEVAALATYAAAAGTVLSTAGMVAQGNAAAAAGKAQQDASRFAAAQMEQQAGQERVAAQRASAEELRQGRFVQSRIQALSAASGAGPLDPSAMQVMSDVEAETLLRSRLALSAGEERARGLETGAAGQRFEGTFAQRMGRARRSAAFVGAGATALQGGSTLFERYG